MKLIPVQTPTEPDGNNLENHLIQFWNWASSHPIPYSFDEDLNHQITTQQYIRLYRGPVFFLLASIYSTAEDYRQITLILQILILMTQQRLQSGGLICMEPFLMSVQKIQC